MLKYPKILLFIILLFSLNGLSAQEINVQNISNDKKEATNQYWNIVQDLRGIMYFASPEGVYEYDGLSWRLILLPDSAEAFAFEKNKIGRIYVGGKNEIGYLAPKINGEMVYVSIKSKIPEQYADFGRIVSIEKIDGKIAFLSDQLLFIMDEKNLEFEVIQAYSYFYSLTSINNEFFLVDEDFGLLKLEKEELKPIKNGEHLISYIMMPYDENKLLINSPNNGLLIFEPSSDKFTSLTSDFLKYDIKSGKRLKNGNFALGSVSNGCIIMSPEGKELYKINKANGTIDNAVYSIYENYESELWIAFSKGISLIYNENEIKTYRVNIRSCYRRSDENIIFGGTFLNTKDSLQSLTQPEEQNYSFNYKDNGFRFTFASNQYYNVTDIEYQYFMKGLDQEPTNWTNRPYSEYTNLSWGNYTLEIKARNSKGEISEAGIYAFTIKTPWYESWWFFGGQIVFILLLLVIAVILYKKGKSEKIAGRLISIAIVIIFEYLEGFISPIFQFLAIGIAVTIFFTNIVIAVVISPIENLASKTLRKYIKRK